MQQRLAYLIMICFLLVSCGVPVVKSQTPTAASADTQPATQAFTRTVTSTETLTTIPPTDTPAPTKVIPLRWFWAIGKKAILAFNATGQVNTVLDLTGIHLNGSDNTPIRVNDDRGFVFFGNNDNSKAFLLTPDSAIPIKLPNIHAPIAGNGWGIQAEHDPYIVLAPVGTLTAPAMLINIETGQAKLLATNVFSPTEIFYMVYFSADGQSLRFATGEGPVDIHNLDLKSGKDTIFYHSSSHLRTDIHGDLWYDPTFGTGSTADGQAVTLAKADGVTGRIALDNGWMLTSKYNCDKPCTLQVQQINGNSTTLNYSLPIKLSDQSVMIQYAQRLDQERLLISINDLSSSNAGSTIWLLTPDGSSKLLGMGLFSNQGSLPNSLQGLSADNRYILVYPVDNTLSFSVYDLKEDKVLFSETTVNSNPYWDVYYFSEGIIVLEEASANHNWVYNFSTVSVSQVGSPAGDGYCTALTADGKPICMTNDGVMVYDPASGVSTPLIKEPVNNLSN